MRASFRCLILIAALLSACSRSDKDTAHAVQPQKSESAAQPAKTPSTDAAQLAKSLFDPKMNPDAAVGHFVSPKSLTASERKYGMAPKRDPRVKYADGIILMEQGDQAIQDAASDGITWTFDANAAHVSEFEEGKIVFATGRAVGRIAQISKSGNSVSVKLAPVQINEVIENGHFIVDDDLDTTQAIIYEAPGFPAMVPVATPAAQPTVWQQDVATPIPAFQQTAFIQPALPSGLGGLPQVPNLNTPPAPTVGAPMTLNDAMRVIPVAGSDSSVGLNFSYNKDGVHVDSTGKLVLKNAHIRFALDIEHFKIITAGMQLGGAAAFTIEFKSWADQERFINAKQTGSLPADISLPLPVAGVPLCLTFHTSFSFGSGFSAKQSILTATGEYTAAGDVFIGIKNGTGVVEPFTSVRAKTALAEGIQGISVGITSMTLAFNIRPMIGIGAFGFNTGVFVGLGFGGSMLKQSDVVLTHCVGGYITGDIDSGVGYQLNKTFVKMVNAILSVFTKYLMPESGILIPGPHAQFMNLPLEIPDHCATAKQNT